MSKSIPQVQSMFHIFYVLLIHEANIYLLKDDFLLDAQLAEFLHYDVTKIN